MTQFPAESFTCKDIILSVINKHKKFELLLSVSPELRKKFTYIYEDKTVTVGSSMSLYFDVFFICCLHYISRFTACTRPIRMLIDIMTKKYDLKYDYDRTITENSQALTMYRIARCFPSVTINACKMIRSSINDTVFLHFPKLPSAMFHPYFIYVIPDNLDNVPIALFMYLMIMEREHGAKLQPLPLMTYYNIIKTAYTAAFFPEFLKIQLNLQWRIIDKKQRYYSFCEFLAIYCKKAKNLLRHIKKDDPELVQILNII